MMKLRVKNILTMYQKPTFLCIFDEAFGRQSGPCFFQKSTKCNNESWDTCIQVLTGPFPSRRKNYPL